MRKLQSQPMYCILGSRCRTQKKWMYRLQMNLKILYDYYKCWMLKWTVQSLMYLSKWHTLFTTANVKFSFRTNIGTQNVLRFLFTLATLDHISRSPWNCASHSNASLSVVYLNYIGKKRYARMFFGMILVALSLVPNKLSLS